MEIWHNEKLSGLHAVLTQPSPQNEAIVQKVLGDKLAGKELYKEIIRKILWSDTTGRNLFIRAFLAKCDRNFLQEILGDLEKNGNLPNTCSNKIASA